MFAAAAAAAAAVPGTHHAYRIIQCHKSAKRVKAAFDVVERVHALLCADPNTAFLDFYTLWKAYPDVPMDFVEWLLTRRDDLDRAAVREVMEQCRSKAEDGKEVEGRESTLFAKAFKG